MGPIQFLLHLFGFVAPALAVALLMASASRWVLFRTSPRGPFWLQVLINASAGTAVLAAGLWGFGVDGKMLSYAALVLVVASVQWSMNRGWHT